ncbi:nucleotidyltransferase domain-containing protein [Desulfosarcina sp. OttesenSCG-928-A07]|nr:nucleotidyltransferase domain-containing protein [Desulfosarcina sp. OttesenSCG-928-A07]
MKEEESTQHLLERAKELQCMYEVDDVLQNNELGLIAAMENLVDIIPAGFSHPSACRVQIALWGEVFAKADFSQARVLHVTPILVEEDVMGEISVGYIESQMEEPAELLTNEIRLLKSISGRISLMALHTERELSLLLNMLHCIDPDMLLHISEKMQQHLREKVGEKAEPLFSGGIFGHMQTMGEVNAPQVLAHDAAASAVLGRRILKGAMAFLPLNAIIQLITDWIREQRIFALIKTVDSKDASVGDILDAVNRYSEAIRDRDSSKRNSPPEKWLIAEMAHRFLTSDAYLVDLMVENLRIEDFLPVLQRIIGSGNSMGNLGGKGAGLFIASQLLRHEEADDPLLQNIKIPLTWFIAADQLVDFLHFNDLEELNSYKYNSPVELRATYDSVVAKIKKAFLPPQTVQMLRVVLEEFRGSPLVVRSSSLMEDRHSGAFSGKYKSLFLANQGTRQEKLVALTDAILEVYASMYNPDALQYRRERSMLNTPEQMGVLIQEVVGQKVGKYYLPAFAGVAFSHNLLRWSSRITREGGLSRMVMGLGTRAVDRLKDDYPVIFSPGQPELLINQTPSDVYYYSPRHIDLINMETGSFETVPLRDFLHEAGDAFPHLNRYVSVYQDNFIQEKSAFALSPQNDEMVVTFKTLLAGDTPRRLKRILDVLSDRFGSPIDIEFASDGESLCLLQCRPQTSGLQGGPAPIPQNLGHQDMIFTASRFVSDALIENILYVVYVDADAYSALGTPEELKAVGRVVGLLNSFLPRRKFILMGPGRWGSRGDMKLGVTVTYSDISGTAALIEVAKERRSYVPEVSFGTHFFQDLVEAGIAYLPLYPDQEGIVFKESFFRSTPNLLPHIFPQYAWLQEVVRVFDIPASYQGRTLSLHMNADLEQAVAFLRGPQTAAMAARAEPAAEPAFQDNRQEAAGQHWQWRHYMAEQIAQSLDMEGLGVKGIYLFGSVNTGDAGMGSDIDLILHVDGNAEQRRLLAGWLDGWSRSLARINYLRTGYEQQKMLDVHMVTDADIAAGNSYAIKITSSVDPATPLRLRDP